VSDDKELSTTPYSRVNFAIFHNQPADFSQSLPRARFMRREWTTLATVRPGGLYTQNTPFSALYTVGAYISTDIALTAHSLVLYMQRTQHYRRPSAQRLLCTQMGNGYRCIRSSNHYLAGQKTTQGVVICVVKTIETTGELKLLTWTKLRLKTCGRSHLTMVIL